MGSLLEELARREAAVRQRIEEIRERIAELNGLLEAEEDQLARLVIRRRRGFWARRPRWSRNPQPGNDRLSLLERRGRRHGWEW
ncbi:hypothetical protein [Actinomadura rubrisoli]|uniref:Uncharacterized protein n=1 Tax=Actinomadura rubrisoli TaxID=2530368 RepID=A0A4R5BPY4_9ACTN|nr:hypothetical protein [Actinomadura rubrisoli]TDD86102.1 hypothetical protein E1298_17835 [Actinomadura rubrisoli]